MKANTVTPIRSAAQDSDPVTEVVSMQAVPDPAKAPVFGRTQRLWSKIRTLAPGHALRVTFRESKTGLYTRYQLRPMAKAIGRFLSSSRDPDQKTWYFWLEPEGTAVPDSPGGKR